MCELYTLIKNEVDKECYIQFEIWNDWKVIADKSDEFNEETAKYLSAEY